MATLAIIFTASCNNSGKDHPAGLETDSSNQNMNSSQPNEGQKDMSPPGAEGNESYNYADSAVQEKPNSEHHTTGGR